MIVFVCRFEKNIPIKYDFSIEKMPPKWFIMIIFTTVSRASSTIAFHGPHTARILRKDRIIHRQDWKHFFPDTHFRLLHLFSSLSSDSWEDPSHSGYKRASINWYPGHIASAERQLSETLKAVDVVIEVRDARIPTATAHPKVREWAAGKPRIVVLTRADMVPQSSIQLWKQHLQRLDVIGTTTVGDQNNNKNSFKALDNGQSVHRAVQAWKERSKYIKEKELPSSIHDVPRILDRVEAVLYVDAKHGQGIHSIHRHVLQAGQYVNARRISRGLNPRPLRVGILGYPNVGKSALINRILGQNRAKSADLPGITRQLRWVKVRGDDVGGNTVAYGASATDASGRSITIASASGSSMSKKRGEFELLDSPGIIPANMVDQKDALLLAACNSIGQAAYENQDVAAFFMEHIKSLHLMKKHSFTAPSWRNKCIDRYGFDPLVPINNRRLPSSREYDGLSSTFFADDEIRLPTGEDMIYMVAERKCQGDPETAARMILQDFRAGRLGPIVLQLPDTKEGVNQENIEALPTTDDGDWRRNVIVGNAAKEMAESKGIQLPPHPEGSGGKDETDGNIGRGLFEGW